MLCTFNMNNSLALTRRVCCLQEGDDDALLQAVHEARDLDGLAAGVEAGQVGGVAVRQPVDLDGILLSVVHLVGDVDALPHAA